MAKIILCFGNPYIKEDSLAVKIAEELKLEGIDFKIITDPSHIMEYAGYEEIVIMDAVKGISRVTIINDADKLKNTKSVTMHDMDLSFYLKLLKETGRVKKIKIIGIPASYGREKAEQEIKRLISS